MEYPIEIGLLIQDAKVNITKLNLHCKGLSQVRVFIGKAYQSIDASMELAEYFATAFEPCGSYTYAAMDEDVDVDVNGKAYRGLNKRQIILKIVLDQPRDGDTCKIQLDKMTIVENENAALKDDAKAVESEDSSGNIENSREMEREAIEEALKSAGLPMDIIIASTSANKCDNVTLDAIKLLKELKIKAVAADKFQDAERLHTQIIDIEKIGQEIFTNEQSKAAAIALEKYGDAARFTKIVIRLAQKRDVLLAGAIGTTEGELANEHHQIASDYEQSIVNQIEVLELPDDIILTTELNPYKEVPTCTKYAFFEDNDREMFDHLLRDWIMQEQDENNETMDIPRLSSEDSISYLPVSIMFGSFIVRCLLSNNWQLRRHCIQLVERYAYICTQAFDDLESVHRCYHYIVQIGLKDTVLQVYFAGLHLLCTLFEYGVDDLPSCSVHLVRANTIRKALDGILLVPLLHQLFSLIPEIRTATIQTISFLLQQEDLWKILLTSYLTRVGVDHKHRTHLLVPRLAVIRYLVSNARIMKLAVKDDQAVRRNRPKKLSLHTPFSLLVQFVGNAIVQADMETKMIALACMSYISKFAEDKFVFPHLTAPQLKALRNSESLMDQLPPVVVNSHVPVAHTPIFRKFILTFREEEEMTNLILDGEQEARDHVQLNLRTLQVKCTPAETSNGEQFVILNDGTMHFQGTFTARSDEPADDDDDDTASVVKVKSLCTRKSPALDAKPTPTLGTKQPPTLSNEDKKEGLPTLTKTPREAPKLHSNNATNSPRAELPSVQPLSKDAPTSSAPKLEPSTEKVTNIESGVKKPPTLTPRQPDAAVAAPKAKKVALKSNKLKSEADADAPKGKKVTTSVHEEAEASSKVSTSEAKEPTKKLKKAKGIETPAKSDDKVVAEIAKTDKKAGTKLKKKSKDAESSEKTTVGSKAKLQPKPPEESKIARKVKPKKKKAAA